MWFFNLSHSVCAWQMLHEFDNKMSLTCLISSKVWMFSPNVAKFLSSICQIDVSSKETRFENTSHVKRFSNFQLFLRCTQHNHHKKLKQCFSCQCICQVWHPGNKTNHYFQHQFYPKIVYSVWDMSCGPPKMIQVRFSGKLKIANFFDYQNYKSCFSRDQLFSSKKIKTAISWPKKLKSK